MIERFGSIAVQALILAFVGHVLGRSYWKIIKQRFGFSPSTDAAAYKTWSEAHRGWSFCTAMLTVGIFGPAAEEVLYRALLIQYGNCNTPWGWATIVAVNMVFAAGHKDKFFDILQTIGERPMSDRMLRWAKAFRVVSAFITGTVFAWIGITTHSLFAAFLAHAAWNLLVSTGLLILIPLILFTVIVRVAMFLDDTILFPIRIARRRRRMRHAMSAWRRSP